MTSRHEGRQDRRVFLKWLALAGGAAGLAEASRAALTGADVGASPPSPAPAAVGPGRAPVRVTDVRTWRMHDALFVEVVSDAGVAGWGECGDDHAFMERFVQSELKERVVGQDPFDGERLWDLMFYRNHDLGPGGVLTNAIAGVDCALWDLKGRLLGLPVHKLIGGAYRDRVRVYGSFGIGNTKKMPPEQAARKAARFVEKGFTAVKVRLQIRELNLNPEPEIAFDYVRAVRQAIGEHIDLLVDANNGYTAARAIQVGRRLYEEFNIRYFEDPVSDQTDAEMAQVVAALEVPIIAGEKEYTRWQLRDLIVSGNVDVINPDVVKVGGITEMKKIAALAQTYQKPIIPHNTRPTLATAASLQFVASIPNMGPFMEFPDIDEFTELLAVMKTNVEFRDGYLTVPTRPGLGVEVDAEAVRKAMGR
ncbi:MAG TPA: mandelate racemase/muconate lactonizing enzyme family protein [Thermoanaerobaculaceae bacterium]|nr:mandelate racemase/muconate lactonizing enzyme family protein [Thermoanaerobaculaceae bacterium]